MLGIFWLMRAVSLCMCFFLHLLLLLLLFSFSSFLSYSRILVHNFFFLRLLLSRCVLSLVHRHCQHWQWALNMFGFCSTGFDYFVSCLSFFFFILSSSSLLLLLLHSFLLYPKWICEIEKKTWGEKLKRREKKNIVHTLTTVFYAAYCNFSHLCVPSVDAINFVFIQNVFLVIPF